MKPTIIWDWNGTLLNDVEVCIASVNRLLARRDLERMDLRRYHSIFTFPVRTYYERMGFDFGSESFADVAVEFHEAYGDLVSLAPLQGGALEVLDKLRHHGAEQVVLSALEENRLRNELEIRGIDRYFAAAFGLAGLDATSKIDRGHELLHTLGVEPRECWLIGDTEHDREVALELGVNPVLVSCGHQSAGRLRETGSTVVDSLSEAAAHIISRSTDSTAN